ncbi:MAG: hypothetical protein CM15mP74_36410 [Halieaceae bacterium]|nr:MAG: hypothetical protein CM15mP74_36410 [Halieaceae bacterium]
MMRRFGHMPLPPYIEREDTLKGRERYQTLYGSSRWCRCCSHRRFFILIKPCWINSSCRYSQDRGHTPRGGDLSAGQGREIEDHTMHSEYIEVRRADAVTACRRRGRVIAIGTTAVRLLESGRFAPRPKGPQQ